MSPLEHGGEPTPASVLLGEPNGFQKGVKRLQSCHTASAQCHSRRRSPGTPAPQQREEGPGEGQSSLLLPPTHSGVNQMFKPLGPKLTGHWGFSASKVVELGDHPEGPPMWRGAEFSV